MKKPNTNNVINVEFSKLPDEYISQVNLQQVIEHSLRVNGTSITEQLLRNAIARYFKQGRKAS